MVRSLVDSSLWIVNQDLSPFFKIRFTFRSPFSFYLNHDLEV